MQTTLIENPEFKIQSGKDGVWLLFKTEKGLSASINLHVIGKAITEWAKEYASKPKQATIQDLIDDLESENAEPKRMIPFQLHDGLRRIQGIYIQGKYGREDKDGIEFLKQYRDQRNKE